MGLKVSASGEEIGDCLDKYSINCDISPSQPLFIKGEREIRLLFRGEEDYELNPENRALVQGQMVRYSEIKGQKVGSSVRENRVNHNNNNAQD